jgi:hypothetical protein
MRRFAQSYSTDAGLDGLGNGQQSQARASNLQQIAQSWTYEIAFIFMNLKKVNGRPNCLAERENRSFN